MVYYTEEIQTKISQGKKDIECRQSSDAALPLSCSHRAMDNITFLALICDNTYRALLTRKAYLHLGVQSLCWGSVTGA